MINWTEPFDRIGSHRCQAVDFAASRVHRLATVATSRAHRLATVATQIDRNGFIMPIVLVVLATLTLAVTIFAEQMLAEYRATRSMTGQLQAACAAQSGVEFALKHIQAGSSKTASKATSTRAFQLQPLDATREAGFWIVAEREQGSANVNYGLRNESGKLNLNGLSFDTTNAEASRNRLLQLPRMTPQIADAILDWIDPDDAQRASGAERNWYSAARATRLPTQRPLKELAELMFVRGVTTELLFGEDTNGNGWLDDCENDGAITPPVDNADGRLDRGWSQFLTVVGAESNYRDTSRLKVHLNDSNLVKLYDQLLPELGPTATAFIVALRLEGPRQQGVAVRESEQNERDERLRSAPKRLKDQLDRTSTSGPARRGETRGGLDLSGQPTFVIESMADLIGREVLTIIDGQQELLKSPWDVSQIESAIARLEKVCTTKPGQQLTHRINIQFADPRVLSTIPGIDANKALSITTRRPSQPRTSVGWLVSEGLMTIEQLRTVAPFMTTGGDVWSGTSIGTAVQSSSLVANHFVIDATLPVARLLSAQESMPFTLPANERPQL